MNELIRVGSIEDLVAHRDRCLELVERGFSLLAEASREFAKAAPSARYVRLYSGLDRQAFYQLDQGDVHDLVTVVRAGLDREAWAHLRDALGLKAVMDAQAIKDFNASLKAPPEFTLDNAAMTFREMVMNADQIFERGVITVFQSLDRQAFRRNNAFRVGASLVMKGALGDYGFNHYGEREQQVRDLDRIFHLLDGRTPKDPLCDAAAWVSQASRTKPAVVETDYLRFKLYKNQNLHVWFKDRTLLDKVNRIIARYYGEVLPDDRTTTAV